MIQFIFIFFLVSIVLVASTTSTSSEEWQQMEVERSHPVRNNFLQQADTQDVKILTWDKKADSEFEHSLVFQVQNGNDEEFRKLLLDIGNPESDRYGQQISSSEFLSLTRNHEGEEIISEYLKSSGARVTTHEPGFITAVAPIRVWNNILRADFHMVHTGKPHLSVPRTRAYHLPKKIAKHVAMVLNTVQIPIVIDPNEPPAFTSVFVNSTDFETEEFSARITQKSSVGVDGDEF